uniref:Uncharacterized protein n=1 Tax=Arundo donax TaxID=35708 RepID=A0A0A9DDQ9_ARUDO
MTCIQDMEASLRLCHLNNITTLLWYSISFFQQYISALLHKKSTYFPSL